jgi:large subunit ribosomal protein L25
VKGNLLHVDLKRIDLSKRIRVSVPVVTSGEAKGIKLQGGLLEVVTRQIEIECVPDSIPAQYVLDVTELIIGQSKRAGDILLGEGVRLVSSPETVVAHVVGVRAVEEVAAPVAEAVAGSEPEVAKKGKKEDEAAPAAPEKGKKK